MGFATRAHLMRVSLVYSTLEDMLVSVMIELMLLSAAEALFVNGIIVVLLLFFSRKRGTETNAVSGRVMKMKVHVLVLESLFSPFLSGATLGVSGEIDF